MGIADIRNNNQVFKPIKDKSENDSTSTPPRLYFQASETDSVPITLP